MSDTKRLKTVQVRFPEDWPDIQSIDIEHKKMTVFFNGGSGDVSEIVEFKEATI